VNMFATHVGKYFSNSIREDGLLAISEYGVVFAPGSAATIEEVFINAAQNHYATYNFCSPMMFLGETHYLQSQVYSCLAQQAVGHAYAGMITISDEPENLLRFLQQHPPIKVDTGHDPASAHNNYLVFGSTTILASCRDTTANRMECPNVGDWSAERVLYTLI
jgi:hypothetical protein